MSNDIAALARTLRQAAEEELMCREASDTSDLWQDEAGPENVLALVEALEKAQKLATQQGNIACALFDEVTAQRNRIAELDKRLIEYAGIATREARRVAELEARTVMLPEPISVLHRRDFTDAHRAIYAYPAAEVNAALAAAGIKVKG